MKVLVKGIKHIKAKQHVADFQTPAQMSKERTTKTDEDQEISE